MLQNKPLLLTALLLLATSIASAQDLGTVGRVYPIKERDALEEMESRAAKVDWKKEAAKVKPENYRPENSRSLPRAAKDRSFLVDMTYTLTMDIPDNKGGILYPKGYTFNPLDYIPFNKVMVVINGDDKDQVAWLKSSPYFKQINASVSLTEGSAVELEKKLGRQLFYSTAVIVDRFKLVAVPSVIKREGRMILVEEYDVRPKKKR